jgi:hypothetical protein
MALAYQSHGVAMETNIMKKGIFPPKYALLIDIDSIIAVWHEERVV